MIEIDVCELDKPLRFLDVLRLNELTHTLTLQKAFALGGRDSRQQGVYKAI
jgi:hypothetical protein